MIEAFWEFELPYRLHIVEITKGEHGVYDVRDWNAALVGKTGEALKANQ